MTRHMPPPADDVGSAEMWAREIIRAAVEDHGTPLPRYGSPEWALLPAPQRWAAALIAAECWRTESNGHEIAARLALELEQINPGALAAAKQAEDAEWQVQRDRHAAAWDHRSGTFRPDPRIAVDAEEAWTAWITGDDDPAGAAA